MSMVPIQLKPLGAALIALSLLSACGGGGSGTDSGGALNPNTGGQPTPGNPSTENPSPGNPSTDTPTGPEGAPAPVAGASMTMSCPDGMNYHCSGRTLLRTERYGEGQNAAALALTASGVQAYGRSTSDLLAQNPTMTTAYGLAPASGGLAEVRLAKDASGATSSPILILNNLGLTWDGSTERPTIIETFRTTAGRLSLQEPSGIVAAGPLPPSEDLSFYDYATNGARARQEHYANNVYFPRSGNPPRCPADVNPCPEAESSGLRYEAGNWRTGGLRPDQSNAARLHEDGDIHAGDGNPGPNGERTYLPGGSGYGIPFPGSKGYRSLNNLSYQYSNVATWVTQDTVVIEEWAHAGNEHNKVRRGAVAYGAVTDPAAVPSSGTASYSGIVYGWYSADGSGDPVPFNGDATATVNFATRQVTVNFQGMRSSSDNSALPLNFSTNTLMGWNGTNTANYLTGAANASAAMSGGVSGRFFGPVSNTAPPEIAGALSLSNGTSGATMVGGFIARRQ